jgi:hypothetical protein
MYESRSYRDWRAGRTGRSAVAQLRELGIAVRVLSRHRRRSKYYGEHNEAMISIEMIHMMGRWLAQGTAS